MASSVERTVERGAVEPKPPERSSADLRRLTRRALLGLGAAGLAAHAEAQVRTPRRSRPTTMPTAEQRLLRRITMGATIEDVNWMNALGYYQYIEWQLGAETIGDPDCETRLGPLYTIGLAPLSLFGQDLALVQRQLAEATITRAIYSNRQLLERVVEFWADHFNTNIGTVGIHKTYEDREVYRKNALGTFFNMLSASASSPAMLVYLNNTQSDGRPGRTPNQNYARELMELHTLGVDGGYTQQDVVEVARCFTGWRVRGNTNDFSAGMFFYDPNRHDNGSKLVLGVPIAAGGGFNDGMNVLNILNSHPSTARFVSRKLIRWMLNYDPPASLVNDVAGEFSRTGGNIKAVLRRILHYDNVLWAPPLFKRPFHYVISALRAMNANVTSLNTLRGSYINGMGQAPFQWGPPDGYPHSFEYWAGLPLPRWSFAFNLANNSISGVSVDITALLTGAANAIQIADRIDTLLFAGDMPTADKAALIAYLRPDPPTSTRIRDAFGLALASPGFQWH
jgi:Protein of unknown function (DUF1800)